MGTWGLPNELTSEEGFESTPVLFHKPALHSAHISLFSNYLPFLLTFVVLPCCSHALSLHILFIFHLFFSHSSSSLTYTLTHMYICLTILCASVSLTLPLFLLLPCFFFHAAASSKTNSSLEASGGRIRPGKFLTGECQTPEGKGRTPDTYVLVNPSLLLSSKPPASHKHAALSAVFPRWRPSRA